MDDRARLREALRSILPILEETCNLVNAGIFADNEFPILVAIQIIKDYLAED